MIRESGIRLSSALIAAAMIQATAAAAVFYVDPAGDDANSGSKTAPFKTLERARGALVETARTGEAVTVYLRGGYYPLREPFALGADELGDNPGGVTIAGYPFETAVIGGGWNIDAEWTAVPDDSIPRKGIMKAVLDEPPPTIDELYVNGNRYRMARFPNYDPAAKYFGGTSGAAVAPERTKSWADPAGGYLHALHEAMWGSKHYRIEGVNEDGSLNLRGGWQENRGGGFDSHFRGGYHKEHLFVENIREELDAPGEWYWDDGERTLYVIPRGGDDLNTARTAAAGLQQLAVLRGSAERPVRNVAFHNLTFAHTARVFMEPYERLLRGDWSIARLAAVFIEGAENCAVSDCVFEDLGGNGVFISRYNRNVEVRGCRFNRLGESAVCLVGDMGAARSPAVEYSNTLPQDGIDPTPGPKTPDYPAQCVVQNNLMRDFGRVGKQTAGVFVSMSEEIAVRHNTIFNCPRAAICVNDGCWGGHVIEFNDAFNTVRESGDHGPFNSWGRDRYWKTSYNGGRGIEPFAKERALLDNHKTTHIRNNRFAHEGSHSWGIDLDDGSSNYRVYKNLCLGMGVKLREGFFRRVENNVIVRGFGGFHVWFPECDDVIERNIFVGGEPYQFIRANPKFAKSFDYNLFFNDGRPIAVTGYGDAMTLAQWQAKGFDRHSIAADPLFVDPASGDYRVRGDSPALSLGFENFPMNRFGARKPEFIAEAAQIPRSFTPAPPDGGGSERGKRTVQWLGASMRELAGEAEKSAAGLGAETGVLLTDVPEGSAAAAAGFQAGDVIIEFNGGPVHTLDQLLEDIELHRGRETEIAVFNAVARKIRLSVP